MEAFYLEIRRLHIAAVTMSGSLFLLRALASNVFSATWTMKAAIRYLSYAIDSILLMAAFLLMTIVHQFPFASAWLTAKLLLLIGYIVFGTYALKRAKTRRTRLAFTAAAVVVFLFIVSIARAHNPLGIFAEN
jgi:uncharacterized membrane protein SirB2